MRVKVNRLWHGVASVRDYQVIKAELNHEGLTIECGTESMEIPPGHIADYIDCWNDQEFISIHDGKKYKLVDFAWKPKVDQLSLL